MLSFLDVTYASCVSDANSASGLTDGKLAITWCRALSSTKQKSYAELEHVCIGSVNVYLLFLYEHVQPACTWSQLHSARMYHIHKMCVTKHVICCNTQFIFHLLQLVLPAE